MSAEIIQIPIYNWNKNTDEIWGFWKNTSVNFQEELTSFNVFEKVYTPLTKNWRKTFVFQICFDLFPNL